MMRLIKGLFVTALSVLFVLAASYLSSNQLMFYEVSERLCGILRITDKNAILRFCVLIRYLVMLTPLLWTYYFSILVPRVKKPKKYPLVLSLVALFGGAFVAMLPVTSLYYKIFSKICYWQVNPYFTRIPAVILNFIACAAAVVIIIKVAYYPAIKDKTDTWLTQAVFTKIAIRYICTAVLAHVALWFIISLKGILLYSLVGNMQDYILAAEEDSKYLFGIAAMLIAEPLVHELAFRGLIFQHLLKGVSAPFSAGISSLLYVFWLRGSGMEPYMLLLGLLLCSVTFRTKRLRYAFYIHVGMNFLRFAYLKNADKFPFGPVARLFGLEKRVIVTLIDKPLVGIIVCAALIIIALAFLKKNPAE